MAHRPEPGIGGRPIAPPGQPAATDPQSAGLATLLAHRPTTTLALLVVAHALLWTLAPALSFRTPPLDVAENLLWGAEWQLGYYKHPPLQAWLSQAAFIAGGGHWAIYLLSSLSICAVFICQYLLGRDLASPRRGALAAILFSVCFYATIPVPEFNANIVQMPIWAFAGLALWRALQRRSLGWWLALGVACAFAVYAKYSAIFLFGALTGAMLAHPAGRASLRGVGPYAAILLATCLVAPHLIWLADSGFQPIVYATKRAGATSGAMALLVPLKFLLAQIADFAAVFALVLIGGAAWPLRRVQGLVLWLAFGPLALMVAYSLISGAGMRDMWGAPAVVWIPLAMVMALPEPTRMKRMLTCWAALFVATPVAVGTIMAVGPGLGLKPQRPNWPGSEINARLEDIWAKSVGGSPGIIAGSTWRAGMAVANATWPVSGFVSADFKRNPWITPARVDAQGVLFLWKNGPNPYTQFGPFIAEGSFETPFGLGSDRSVTTNWAIRPGNSYDSDR